jgi:hypothetical protein
MQPNLFNYATSELSQDAFICWLIAWSDSAQIENDKFLNSCASIFVKKLIGVPSAYEIISIEVGRQWNNIDVWALVNNQYFLVIEDKKGTVEHSDQLKRYAEIAREHYKKSDIEIKLVYFKMQEQGQYTNVEKAGFTVFGRTKMLEILTECVEKVNRNEINDILFDYYRNLQGLDKKINSYKELPLDKWYWHSWIGFYSELQNHLGGNWDYVANASGGFLGFWWYWNSSEYKENYFEFYLQLEEGEMVFKLYCEKPDTRYEIRDFYRSKLYSKAKELEIDVYQFGRIGQWMGVARLNESYRKTDSNGLIDMNKTIATLKKMQLLLDEINNSLKE